MKWSLILMFFFPGWAQGEPRVRLGVEVLVDQNFSPLQGKRIGLITNHTGKDRRGRRTVDILYRCPGLRLVKIFSPEHGFQGQQDKEGLAHGKDTVTGLPIYSLYGETRRPTPEMLEGIDALVYDIQDIGARFYTYITTLAYAMEEASLRGLSFIVLDRPNPMGGGRVEGGMLADDVRHFTAYIPVPIRHGLTVGEIARYYKEKARLFTLDLTIVPMRGWKRSMWFDETDLPWRPTSPNMRTLRAATLYPGLAFLEAANVSVGRGTRYPFEQFGAPWMDGREAAKRIQAWVLPGLEAQPVNFRPKSSLYQKERCSGVRLKVTNRDAFRPVEFGIRLLYLLRDLHPQPFQIRWDEMPRLIGTREFEHWYQTEPSPDRILQRFARDAEAFRDVRAKFLLYE